MHIGIFRTENQTLNIDSYNCQEIGLARSLAKMGNRVSVYMSGDELVEPLIDEVIPGSQVTIFRSKARNIKLIQQGINRAKIRAIQPGKFDFIQINEYNEIESFLLAIRARKAGIPFIIYQGMYTDIQGRVQKLYQRIFGNFALPFLRRNAEYVLTKTEWAAEFVRSKGFSKVHVLPVGLDPSQLDRGTEHHWRDQLNIAPEVPIVLYVGRLEARRNTNLLLEIAERFSKRGIAFIFAGRGEDFERAENFVRAQKLENVHLLGTVPQSQLRSLYQTSTCLVLPSNYEIFGMVLLEAMYFGLPPISSRTAGAEQIIQSGKDGIVVDNLSYESWEAAINLLLSNKVLISQLSNNAQDKIRSSMLWDHIARDYLNYVPKATTGIGFGNQ